MSVPSVWRQVPWQARGMRLFRRGVSSLYPHIPGHLHTLPLPPRPPAVRENRLVAPMPGVVTRYLVEEGQRVQEGQVVAYLEAMKMENALTAPCGGVVRLQGRPGQKVQRGEVLAIIE
ncbi:MAG: acetyl-CoA carboxylase biotin carboxyl carrier protein subunit [Chloroflexota bacterium]|nr:acetyl-CoA carboxylase biotin carboxyl carrier protein subunit [Chloroflexota bacterium]